ncbi:polysaccharide deacetylase family protein [Pontibacter amylolyticus]|uniref:NodB homology domain-containing protein n=1 Tax=Pontibacter amylolyticus TaxID=1424080 RepID=A0ABQ1W3I8_9BACT|nr:polysaccharide deacetylase family protein [Pontibacter amylolyticus]GGG12510.1 hypothetical protein GCM10011323_16180 [Pontibacter amylolyticus]
MINKFACALKYVVANILMLLGYVERAKIKALRGDHILSLYFHKPSKEEFEKCLKWLRKNGFQFLSTTDLKKIIDRESSFPKGAVVLTVDDGWLSNVDNIVKTAETYQVPVTIFVSTEPIENGAYWWSYLQEAHRQKLTDLPIKTLKQLPNIERLSLINEFKKKTHLQREAMTIAQIQKISSSPWITIGGHTVSHPILTNCSYEQVYNELMISKEKLESWTGKNIDYFAYPNGNYSEREIHILQLQGYKMAFTVNPKHLTPHRLHKEFELPRIEVIESASFPETICRMMGVWEPLMQRLRRVVIGQPQNYQKPVKSF